MDYVCNFIMATEYDKEMFGKWYYIARKHLRSKPEQQEPVKPQREAERETKIETETEQTGKKHGVARGSSHHEEANATGEENDEHQPNGNKVESTVVGAAAKTKTNTTSSTTRNTRMEAPPETTQAYRKSPTYMKNTASKPQNQNAVAARTRRRNSLNN